MLLETQRDRQTHYLDDWHRDGFFVLRNVFSCDEMNELTAETDRLLQDCSELISPQNLRCRYMPHHETGESLFEVFDPVNDLSSVCTRFCHDERLLSVLDTIYREPACLFKEKLIFKPPGALGYRLHQDIPLAWDGFPKSFLTVMLAIDPSTEENGCTQVYSGYHRDFLSQDGSVYMLPDDAVDASRQTSLVLNPGDVAFFHGLTPHRSDANRSQQMRRVFYLSYNARSDGGDQRAAHYLQFRKRLSEHRRTTTTEPLYFR